jgi:hypothetical protein
MPLLKRSPLIVFLILFLTSFSQAQLINESGSLREFLAGSEPAAAYDNWISHISENIAISGYNAYAPEMLDRQLNGFGEFDYITNNTSGNQIMDMFREIFAFLLLNDPASAAAALLAGPQVDYELVEFTDSEQERTYYILRETLNMDYFDAGMSPGTEDDVNGGFDHSWGIFIFSPQSARPEMTIQAPHPNDDYPSPYLAMEFFFESDAGMLMINGAGREVEWSTDPYNNGRSRSDPTRNCFHPWHAAHEVVTEFWQDQGLDELIVQVHTYDDVSHRDLKSCVAVSGRFNRIHYPVMYDTGGGSKGMFSNLQQPIFSSNELGWQHDEWRIQDYVSSNQLYPFTVDGGIPDSMITISISPWLWGYSHSCQFDYTFGVDAEGYAECDRMERIIHIEVDELPTPAHEQGEEEYYAIDGITVASWQNFSNSWEFAKPLFDALLLARDSLRSFTDEQAPTMPGNLELTDFTSSSLSLSWSPSLSVYFDTYIVLVDTSDTITENAAEFTLEDASQLCWPGTAGVEVTDLILLEEYSLAVVARDEQGRESAMSNVIHAMPDDLDPPQITPFGPLNAFENEEILMMAQIKDETGIESATVNWSLNGLVWDSVDMEADGDIFSAVLPAQNAGSRIYFNFVAADLSGHSNTSSTNQMSIYVLTDLYIDNINMSSPFVHDSFDGGTDQWSLSSARMHTPFFSWKFGGSGTSDHGNNTAGWLYSPEYFIPIGLEERTASFWSWVDAEQHSQYADSCYDGAVIQIRSENSNWQSAELIPPYPHALYSGSDVALDWPQPMISGSSDWTQYSLALPEDGHVIQIRFGFVSDGSVTNEGWYVDDLRIGALLPENPELVTELSVQLSGNNVILSWLEVAAAINYRIYVSNSAYENGQELIAEVDCCDYVYQIEYGNTELFFQVKSVVPDALLD